MKYLIVSMCMAMVPQLAPAQSLTECVNYAQAHSLRIKSAQLQMQRAHRNEGSFFEIDKTELSLSQDPTSGGSPDNAFTLSQRVDFPTVYASRRQLLKAETAVEAARTQLTASELTKEVAEVYTDILLSRHEAELLKQNDSILSDFVRIAKVRLTNGETNRLEVLNAEQLQSENKLRLQSVISRMSISTNLLQTLMNADFAVVPIDDYIPAMLQGNEMVASDYAYNITPQGVLMDAERQLAERKLKLVRQDFMPSFSLGIRHQFVMSGLNPYDVDRSKFEKGGWMGFEFGVAFPLFFGSQKAKTAVAKYDVELVNNRLAEESSKAGAAYQAAQASLATAYNSYNQWQHVSLPHAREIRRLSLIEYQAGEISYVEHIQHLNAALEAELSAAQAADELNKAIIKLNYITGK